MSKLRGQVHVRVNEKVTLEHLNNIVANLARLSGCETCGILGFDLRLTGDPVDPGAIGRLPGVASVSFE